MMRTAFLRIMPAALALCAAVPAAAQDAGGRFVVRGSIRDAATGAPIELAWLDLPEKPAQVRTDAAGGFRLPPLYPGEYTLYVSRYGYAQMRLRINVVADDSITLRMTATPLMLAGITATQRRALGSMRGGLRMVRLADFYRRAERSPSGRFITRQTIEEKRPVVFTDLLYGIPGVRVEFGPTGKYITVNRAFGSFADRDCSLRYFLDGMPLQVDGPPDVYFPVQMIEGVEVYQGNVPALFGGGSSDCGVVAVWSKLR